MYARIMDDRLELFQWDSGVYMEVSSDVERIDFHFRNTNGIVYGVFAEQGKVYIPDILLQKSGVVDAMIMAKSEDSSITVERREITVAERPMPPGYMVTKKGSILTTDELQDLIYGLDILPISGGTMAGDIDMDGYMVCNLDDAENSGDAVSKHYGDFTYLRREGGTMTGRIDGLLPPLADNEPARKKELDENDAKAQGYANTAEQNAKEYTDAARMIILNKTVSKESFVADTTYADYGFRAAVAIEGATENMIPDVTFPVQDDVAFACVAHSYDGGIYIYADDQPENGITIPTIIMWRGDES